MSEMTAFGMNAKFNAKLAKATEEVFASNAGVPSLTENAELIDLAARSPRAAILESWTRLERTLREKILASGHVSVTDANVPITRLIEAAKRVA
jgi:hypothetical protein